MKNVIGAKCTICGKMIEATPDITVCPNCGGIIDIE